MDNKYGLTQKQLLDAFYAMAPAHNESAHQFVLRVEEKRIKYHVTEDSCKRSFLKALPEEFLEELDNLGKMAVAVSVA